MSATFSVSEITRYIKGLFARDFMLSRVAVEGEVSNCSHHRSGHIYFTLKDESSELRCVMFASSLGAGLDFRLEDGQQVEVRGRIGVYERSGAYQLYAERIVLSGEGELYRRFLELKERLEEMGMFDPIYKRPIPRFASSIGIVTAPGGAALRDIISVSRRRNPYVRLVLCPTLVQGEGAASGIAAAIRRLDSEDLDVLIVGRGGGSIEDLWAFNEEIVAQAIFEADTPIISAVGHETDFTIADFVADLRAATPSAAAELANFVYGELAEELSARRDAMRGSIQRRIADERKALELGAMRIRAYSPGEVLGRSRETLGHMGERLRRALGDKLSMIRKREEIATARLDALSPLRRISGGYAFVTGPTGTALRSVEDTAIGETLCMYLSDGVIEGKVSTIRRMKR